MSSLLREGLVEPLNVFGGTPYDVLEVLAMRYTPGYRIIQMEEWQIKITAHSVNYTHIQTKVRPGPVL